MGAIKWIEEGSVLRHVPLANPKPNAREFVDIVMGRVSEHRVPLVEYLVDDVVMKPIVTELLGRSWVPDPGSADRDTQRAYLDTYIEFWYRLGYDCVRFERGLDFPRHMLLAPDVAPGSDKQRAWVDEHVGTIQSWADFERYRWPKIEEMDFWPFEYLSTHLPDGMGLMTCHAAGVFEHLSQIMSLEGLAFALHDAPNLVKAVVDRIGELLVAFYRHLVQLDNVVAIFQGDDMGFRTGTLIAPHHLREYCLPWLKRLSQIVHEHGLPYFLHSCGNLESIMEDLITDVRIDAKHSFEDAILPVEEFQNRYGQRIGVLGGVDLNILASADPQEVRRRTRELIETCGTRGRYAVGSGNSIPSYVPVNNYLALVDEAVCAMGY